MDDRTGHVHARRAREAAAAAASSRRGSRSCSTSTRSARRCTAAGATSTRASTPTRRRPSSTGSTASTAPSTCCSIPTRGATTAARGCTAGGPSYDGRSVAYQISEHNSDETVMHVIDVATGKDLPDVIEGTKYAAASWTPGQQGLLLHLGAAGRRRGQRRRPPRIRRAAVSSRSARRSGEGPGRPRGDRRMPRPSSAAGSRATATG